MSARMPQRPRATAASASRAKSMPIGVWLYFRFNRALTALRG